MKICLSPKNWFFGQNFFCVQFLQRSYVHFRNQYEKTDFLIPHSTWSKKKSFHLSVNFLWTKKSKMEATTQYLKGNEILIPVYKKPFSIRISSPFKIFMPDIWASKSQVRTTHILYVFSPFLQFYCLQELLSSLPVRILGCHWWNSSWPGILQPSKWFSQIISGRFQEILKFQRVLPARRS